VSDEISVRELRARRERGEDPLVLDVREPDEVAAASLPDSLNVPMAQVPGRVHELPRNRDIVVLCHLGGRSERVTHYLRASGFTRAVNLAGGIDAWSREVDPEVPRY
jgi:rhodanese-related sulfurtransferase